VPFELFIVQLIVMKVRLVIRSQDYCCFSAGSQIKSACARGRCVRQPEVVLTNNCGVHDILYINGVTYLQFCQLTLSRTLVHGKIRH